MDFSNRENEFVAYESRNILPVCFRFGILGGGILVLISITAYYSNLMESGFLGMLNLLVFFGTVIFSMRECRKKVFAGTIPYWKAVWAGTLTTFFMMFTEGLWRVVHYIIDPGLQEGFLQRTVVMLEGFGFSEEEIDQFLDMSIQMMQPMNVLGMTIFSALIIGVIISLPIAAFVAKKAVRE